MVNFKKFLSPDTIARMDEEKRIIARLHSTETTNAMLGMAILGMARQLRTAYIEAGRASSIVREYPVYDGDLVWNVLPDLAWRMGMTNRNAYVEGERKLGERVLTLNGAEYRRYVWSVLRNSNLDPLIDRTSPGSQAASLLARDAIHGNPVEIALQRLYPAEIYYVESKPTHPGNIDPADNISEPARYRGLGRVLSWNPSVDDYKRARAG